MGTSTSISGAGAGSPLIPSWVEETEEEHPNTSDPVKPANSVSGPINQKGRLSSTRRELGAFASSGDISKLRRSVGKYIRDGRHGVASATKRSIGTARRAGTLSGIAGGSPSFAEIRERIRQSISKDADAFELIAAIASAASPLDGTLDSERSQQAASEAMQFLLDCFPDADLLNLTVNQRETLLERFLALDCFALFYAENGKHLLMKCDLQTGATRIREIKDYFCETFRQANLQRKEKGKPSLGSLSDKQISSHCQEIIAEAYSIFEAYLDES